jgi:dienelactone hydrolase
MSSVSNFFNSQFSILNLTAAALLLAAALTSSGAAQSRPAEPAFDAFWKAGNAGEAARAGERLIKSGVDFDTAWAQLRKGRPYKKEKTGEFAWRYPGPAGATFNNVIEVPEDYDPARAWPVRVQLHGGVNRQASGTAGNALGLEGEDGGRGGDGRAPSLGRQRAPNRIPGDNQIYVYPAGWADAAWWHSNQVDNILRVLDRLKRAYNVDESLIHYTGISDGGTGAYYMAMKESTPWSSFLPLNGSIKVLGNPAVRADGELYPSNLANKPLYIVNGGRDPLYPVSHIESHIAAFRQLNVPVTFNPQPAAGHDTTWWKWVRAPFEQFVRKHARVAHPERLSWETERTDRHNRIHWLVIDQLGDGSKDATFTEVEVFPRRKPSGRVDVTRKGNTIEATSRGVREMTLLLSPDVFDFAQPITVTVNGTRAFEGTVKRDVSTLLKWAARDNDRMMLYGAELKLRVP